MKNKLKLFYYIFFKFFNRILKGKPTLILMYHRIGSVSHPKKSDLATSIETFEQQMIYFKEKYHFYRLNENWKPSQKAGLVITFDDGYADNITEILSILEKHQIPATFFVCTLNIDSNSEFWWDKLDAIYTDLAPIFYLPSYQEKVSKNKYTQKHISNFLIKMNNDEKEVWLFELAEINKIQFKNRQEYRSLSKDELRKLSEHPLVDIGIHTHNHYKFSNLSYQEQKQEILMSVKILKELTTRNINYLALPHGDFNDATLKLIDELDISAVVHANNNYSNQKDKSKGNISRILMTEIKDKELEKYLSHYDIF